MMQADGFNKTNNLVVHSNSVFKGLYVIVQNQLPYGENEWDFNSLRVKRKLCKAC